MRDTIRKALGFLGLIEDEYGDFGPGASSRPFTEPADYPEEQWAPPAPSPAPVTPPPARPYASPPAPPMRGQQAARRPSSISVIDGAGDPPRVRPMPGPRPRGMAAPAEREPAILFPTSYNESRRITDLLRGSRVVVLNVADVPASVARRLVDFAAGTSYALGAKIEVLDQGVYLILPQGTHVSAEARLALQASRYRSFDNV